MRILIVAEHASAAFGGEAALPLHYFRILRQRGHDVWLLVHERTRAELSELFDHDPRIHFMPDTLGIRALWRIGSLLPHRVASITTGYGMRLLTQLRQVKAARQLIANERIDVVHQPIPVSPREPTLIYRLGVPVVIGPLNGGMEFPPAFRQRQSRSEHMLISAGRAATNIVNGIFPGKKEAAVLLVANERTREALPSGIGGKVVRLPENGVDLSVWTKPQAQLVTPGAPTRFVFVGRLVNWKAVDLLLEAFKKASAVQPMSLAIVGDGPERDRLEALAHNFGILGSDERPGTVCFTGWVNQIECPKLVAARDALVLPSLYECGGAVVLEAMALEKPVIASNWGGPKDYLDPACGILVDPETPAAFVSGFADAMLRLARSPELRRQMGIAAARKIERDYCWEKKVDTMLGIYLAVQQLSAAMRKKVGD